MTSFASENRSSSPNSELDASIPNATSSCGSTMGKRKASVLHDNGTPAASGTRGAKLARIKGPDPDSLFPSTSWDEDGDTFVRVSDGWLKLHRSLLKRHCVWFDKVFYAIEQGKVLPQTVKHFEHGDMLIVEANDTRNSYHFMGVGVGLKDFEALLHAFNHAISYCHSPPTFETVARILRSSTELVASEFRTWAVQTLENMWPSDLNLLSPQQIPFATETVALARGWVVPMLLKRSMYELLRTSRFGQNLEGSKPPVELSPFDLVCLVDTREYLDSMWEEIIKSISVPTCHHLEFSSSTSTIDSRSDNHLTSLNSHNPKLRDTSCCSIPSSKVQKVVYDSGLFKTFRFDLVCGLQALIEANWETREGCCLECLDKKRVEWNKQRVKIWEDLDTWFRVGTGRK